MNVYGSGGWQSAGSAVNGTSERNTYTATAGQTVFAATYDTGYIDVISMVSNYYLAQTSQLQMVQALH